MLIPSEGREGFIEALGNPSRLRILVQLWKEGEMRVYRISSSTRLGRSSVKWHLGKLVESEIVMKKVYGQAVLYSINKDHPRFKALLEFFKEAKL